MTYRVPRILLSAENAVALPVGVGEQKSVLREKIRNAGFMDCPCFDARRATCTAEPCTYDHETNCCGWSDRRI